MCPDYTAFQNVAAYTMVGVVSGLIALVFYCGVACGRQLQAKRKDHVSD